MNYILFINILFVYYKISNLKFVTIDLIFNYGKHIQ